MNNQTTKQPNEPHRTTQTNEQLTNQQTNQPTPNSQQRTAKQHTTHNKHPPTTNNAHRNNFPQEWCIPIQHDCTTGGGWCRVVVNLLAAMLRARCGSSLWKICFSLQSRNALTHILYHALSGRNEYSLWFEGTAPQGFTIQDTGPVCNCRVRCSFGVDFRL